MGGITRSGSAVVLVVGLCQTASLLAQSTYYVNADCGDDAWSGLSQDCVPEDGPKQTIGEAIRAAVSGDTILVAPGTYLENLHYRGKNIVITSTDGPEATIIDGFSLINGSGTGSGSAQFGGAVSCKDSSATITNNIMRNNTANFGGAIDADGGGPLIVGNLFFDNLATDCHGEHLCGNGGAINLFNSSAIIENNVMRNNGAELNGGGLAIDISVRDGEFNTLCRNNLIVENTAGFLGGGAYLNFRGGLEFQGTTISRNLADLGGDGFYIGGLGGPSASIQNSIVYENGTGEQEIMINGGEVTVRYSDVRNGQAGVQINDGVLNWGTGNIETDPQFVDAGQGDYHLDDCSAAVNAGDPEYHPELDEVDLDGERRLIGTAIDMGVDEVPHDDKNGNGVPDVCECDPCDMNCDGEVNAFDIEPFLGLLFDPETDPCCGVRGDVGSTGDVNGDGEIDAFDIEPFLNGSLSLKGLAAPGSPRRDLRFPHHRLAAVCADFRRVAVPD